MICNPRIWGDTLCRLQEEIPDFAFAAWIRPLATKLCHDRVVLGCPSSFHRDRVRIQFLDALERNLRAATESEAESVSKERAQDRTPPTDPQRDATNPTRGVGRDTVDACSEPEKPVAIEIVTMNEFAAIAGHAIDFGVRDLPGDQLAGARVLRSVQNGTRSDSLHDTLTAEGHSGIRTGVSPERPIAGTWWPQHPGGPVERRPGAPTGAAHASVSPAAHLEAVPDGRDLASPQRRVPGVRANGSDRVDRSGARSAERSTTQPARATRSNGRTTNDVARGAQQPELPFSFESFVVGPCNALAREAALALARTRQRSLNLLYLGGDSGMGKTHLARATAAEARRHAGHAAQEFALGQSPRARRVGESAPGVLYTSAEAFTTDFVSAMRTGQSDSFRRRYRGSIGLLVVEDVQFFSGRIKTQLELFHTLQHVLDAGGRVLLTGDRSPRELTGLDERVRAQVGRGFIAELEPPDAIVRRHILRSKAAGGGVHLPPCCLDLLVDSSQGSVRDVESLLIQVVTTASLLGRPIDLDLTEQAISLKTSIASVLTTKTVAVSEIVRIVAAFFGKRPEALAGRSRRRDVLVPRQLAMYLAHRYTQASFAEIGRSLGRGHPSVRNAIERIDRQILENAPVRYQVEALSERIDSTLSLPRPADKTPSV